MVSSGVRKLKKRLLTGLLMAGILPPFSTWGGVPNPASSVLVIITDDSCDTVGTCSADNYEENIAANIQSALSTLSPAPSVTVQTVACSLTNSGGIGLTTAQLSTYCLVIDARFLNCPGYAPCTNTGESDVITTGDIDTYLSYLGQGGNLYVIGDNSGYCMRDQSIVSLVSAATGCGLGFNSSDVIAQDAVTWSLFNAPLQGAVNNLSGIVTDYPGFIASGQTCGATPLITNGSDVLNMLWEPSQLTTHSGTLDLMMDSNWIAEEGVTCCTTLAGDQYAQYWQNVYAMSGVCYNLQVTKTASPMTVCVGQPVTFTICATNTGSRSITNPQVTDVLPSCLTFQSASPGGSMSGTTFIYDYAGTLATNQSACVTIVAQASSVNCP